MKTQETWTLTVTITVDHSWIADGFDVAERLGQIEANIEAMLPYAYDNEITAKARIKSGPSKDTIDTIQGYKKA